MPPNQEAFRWPKVVLTPALIVVLIAALPFVAVWDGCGRDRPMPSRWKSTCIMAAVSVHDIADLTASLIASCILALAGLRGPVRRRGGA